MTKIGRYKRLQKKRKKVKRLFRALNPDGEVLPATTGVGEMEPGSRVVKRVNSDSGEEDEERETKGKKRKNGANSWRPFGESLSIAALSCCHN